MSNKEVFRNYITKCPRKGYLVAKDYYLTEASDEEKKII